MWSRKRLDISWSDLAAGLARCFDFSSRDLLAQRVESEWVAGVEQGCKPPVGSTAGSATVPPEQSAARSQQSAVSEAAGSPGKGGALVCLSVRTGFDLLLGALDLPRGSEVLMSALTIPDMVRIVEHHGLVAVPVDLDAETLEINGDSLRSAITANTRALVVAHLFGSRMPLEPIADIARRHNLLLIEDCAQAYVGPGYRGLRQADVSMFSFGPIKTATALAGGILRVRDKTLLSRMRDSQREYPVQRRITYCARLVKYGALKAISARPLYRCLVRGFEFLGRDHDRFLNGLVRGFAGPQLFARLRRQPSLPLLALLSRRLRRFDSARLARRTEHGRRLLGHFRNRLPVPGGDAETHSFWVFPLLVDEPERTIAELRNAGFDATQGQSMCVVQPPPGRHDLEPETARAMLSGIVFLPLYPEMPASEVDRMAGVVLAERRPEGTSPAPAEAVDGSNRRNAKGVTTPERAERMAARRAGSGQPGAKND